MRIPWVCTLTLLLIAALRAEASAAPAPGDGRVFYGWASESITPEGPVAVGGQYHTRISGEVHDPLFATALAIETRDGDRVIDQAVIVSCDLSVIRRKTQEQVRELVGKQIPDLDVEKIFLAATHTHTAPALTDTEETDLHPYDFVRSWAYRIPAGETGVVRPAQYLAFLAERISRAVVEAWKARKPGGVSFALSHAEIAHNRRAVYADGTARMYGNTNDPAFSHIEGVSDHSVDVLFFWRDGGRLEGLAINVYCPTQEVEGEKYLSADFWYDARKLLRERYHADLYILPLVGAGGDQSPHLLWNKQAEAAMRGRRNLSSREEIARRIVRAVDDVIDVARNDVLTELPFEHRTERVPLPVWQVSDERYAQAQSLYEAGKDKTDELESPDYIYWRVSRTMIDRYDYQKKDPHYMAELHLLRLGDLAMATNPFELYTDYGVRIKARSPAVQTMVVQLAADCAAYLPTERAVLGGGYSARIDDGVVGPEGGTVFVEETTRILKEMWPR
ncbi:MAG: hypothetical protein ABIP48_25420, partial [Planctomycetota bacterium]